VRWWRLALGGALLLWVLGTAYVQAKRRGRRIGVALLFSGGAVLVFAAAALVPQPPMTASVAEGLVVTSIVLLGLAMAVVLWRGFRA
jgi:hypothetical protein